MHSCTFFCDFYVHKKDSIFMCIKTSKKKKSFVIFVLFVLFVGIKNIWVKTTYVRFVLFVFFVCVKFFPEKKKNCPDAPICITTQGV